MKAIVTVGMGFGDEGKGATVDFLVRELNADLVVRYSGGAQAGHNVELPDGRRHTFAQFGSGTFAGARTYLGPRMIICPLTLVPEANHLQQLGIDQPKSLINAHADCLLATRAHVLMNRLRELDRQEARHGSCGLGIGESRLYWLRHGIDAVVAGDLIDRRQLVIKLRLLRDRMLLEMQKLNRVDPALAASLYRLNPAAEADLIMEDLSDVTFTQQMPETATVIFEASQGVLLDEYFGFHPHTTWSTVTELHAMEILKETNVNEVQTLGITRAYSTRHGAGPFPTEDPQWTARLVDRGNPENAWQGNMRCGPLDLVLLRYAATACRVDAMVVNHVDELPQQTQICRRYDGRDQMELPVTLKQQSAITDILESARPRIENVDRQEIISAIHEIAPVTIIGKGPGFSDRSFVEPAAIVSDSHSPKAID